jgi:hypothetical protein
VDDPAVDDTGAGTPPIVDMGAYEKRLPGPPTDYDGDSDVDGDDAELFEACASGPGIAIEWGCENRDFDGDDDVDQIDFAVFERCVSGEGVPADLNCAS